MGNDITKEMLELRSTGLSYQEIAKRYGVTRQCVHQRIKRALEQADRERARDVYKSLKEDTKKAERLYKSFDGLKVSGVTFSDFYRTYCICEKHVSSPLIVSKRVVKHFGKSLRDVDEAMLTEQILQENTWLTLEQGGRRAKKERVKAELIQA